MAKTHTHTHTLQKKLPQKKEKEESMGYIPKTTADVLTGSSINSGGCESSDCEQTVSYKDGYSVFGVRREKSKRRNWQEKFVCATHVK
jgi:hypothetical protein